MSIHAEPSPSLPSWVPLRLPVPVGVESIPPGRIGGEALAAELVERSRKGCHEAYRCLVERYKDRIYRFCLGWSGNAEDAEELCQDTFVRAYSALPRYRSEDRFNAWLYRIARNRCHDHHRSRSRRDRTRNLSLDSIPVDSLLCPHPGPDEKTANAEDLAGLLRSISSLPASLREVVVLCGFEGLSHEECASILGCGPRAVEGRLYRARNLLARETRGTGNPGP